ncbi:tRNA (adenine22-N1)-methyltransferase [Paenibacillus cellulosilyticus]|uniref:tRNA (Adenine22-N1)-methyltransferase n=1 Tax=Paenibacillus cellulosilyticus TaxID=375489 RepID=A0A2V2YMK7_9BACL|nr:class I SAM-dependent methyltransferase [Paenibacillus cellulosilyticus]PWV95427.1 tRNA (adenine22-N1)-methyltransferase [Paenibacillus cellulosilyticus]
MITKLSHRLGTIAELVQSGARVADIGSDHALLPVYLVSTGKCPTAVAGELNQGPFEAARKQVREAGLSQKVDVRKGNGLAVVTPGETDTITIAGMGGHLIASILEEGRVAGKLEHVSELVLQPNVGEDAVRHWLTEHGWSLMEERILEEDGKIYEVLRAIRSEEAALHNNELYQPSRLPVQSNSEVSISSEEAVELLYRFGPYLLVEPTDVFYLKWDSELRKMDRICGQMEQSGAEEAITRAKQFRHEMAQIEEVLTCLRKDKP